MKLLIIADLHLRLQEPYGKINPETGLNTRLEDKLKLLKFLVDRAIEEEVDGFVILGDVFDRLNPPEVMRQAFINTLVLPLKDAKIPLHILIGNHDTNLSGTTNMMAEDVLGAFKLYDTIDISQTIIGDQSCIFVPFGYDILSVKGMAKHSIVFGHEEIRGASIGAQNWIPTEGIKAESLKDYKLVILGHIHKPQQVADNIYYVGALAKQNFGERDEGQRTILLTVDSNSDCQIESISLPDRPFVQYELNETDKVKLPVPPKGAVVKLVLKGSRSWIGSRNLESAKNALIERGAQQVLFDFKPTDSLGVSLDDKELESGKSLSQEVKDYAEKIDGPENRLEIGIKLMEEV